MRMLQQQLISQKYLRTQMSQNVAAALPPKASCDVFINHRSIDTKRSISSLLYDHLRWLGIRAFLDNKNMKPGDKLFEKINGGIMSCKVGVLVFSPTYCESYFCLHELALMMESGKKVIPIFCDVKPSELRVVDRGSCSHAEVQRFSYALEEAKDTVGIAFDSSKGNWSDVVQDAANIVVERLMESEDEEGLQAQFKQLPSGHKTWA
ncbi:hypothetical protein ACET3Z_016455 [Daucus carota]